MHNFIRRTISSRLSRAGYHIGCYPQLYIAVPFIVSLVLATGLLNISSIKDIEYLYIPSNAKSKIDETAVKSTFPTNMSQCDYRRISKPEAFLAIIVTSKYTTSMLRESIIEDIIKLDEIIRNISIVWNNAFVRYEDLCCKTYENSCFDNFATSLKGKINDMKKGTYKIKYPADTAHETLIISGFEFGGVTTDEENVIRNANAMRLYYPMDSTSEEKKRMALKWEESCLQTLPLINLKHIEIYMMTSESIKNEISRIAESALSLMFIIAPIMLIFSAISCFSTDILTSKPWLGIAGCASPFLATMSAFGLLVYSNMDFIGLNIIILFLILGIGVDDSFIMISAWRRTDVKLSVPERLKETYREAAVSITITSLTNFLAFCTAFLTPYKCIHIFSMYSALATVLDYIYQLFFFGGLMALDGYREKHNLHSIFCWPIKQVEKGIHGKRRKKTKKNIFSTFFGNVLGEILGKSIVKVIVIFIFIIYLTSSIYCMRFIEEREEINTLLPESSYDNLYVQHEYKYFSNYSHQVQIVIKKTLDYSNVDVQNDVEDLLQSFESSPYISDSRTTESWLREYLVFAKSPIAKFSLSHYNLNDSTDFINGFKEVFLKIKVASRFKNDIIFNKNGDQIIACRFVVSSNDAESRIDEKLFLENVRMIADNSKIPVIAYNFRFMYYELSLNVLKNCIKTICLAGVIVLLVFLLFTLNVFFLLSIAISIVSIQIGLIGFMSVWNVTVNTTALITLVMCTGFCVDYTVHTTYAFINCKSKEPNQKIKKCLYAAGYPVLQGCLSTVIGVSVVSFGPAESFTIFFKIVTLMVIFAAFHSLILLPVLLSLLDTISLNFIKSKRQKSDFSESHMNPLDSVESGKTCPIEEI